MSRNLKTYVTSLGFYDLAVAAPSMKAALAAWGSGRNLFHQGFAEETDDPKIVDAAMSKPGVVLKRPVGSKEAFREKAELPKALPTGKPKDIPKPRPKPIKAHERGPNAKVIKFADAKAARQTAAAYEKQTERQEWVRRKNEIAEEKRRKRQGAAIAKAEAALESARGRHEESARKIAKARETIERKSDAEDRRWEGEKEELERAVRKARGVELAW